MTGKGEPWFDQQDEEIFSQLESLSGNYIPPMPEFLKHLESYVNGQDVTLQWKCIGRRAPTPERKETNELENGQFMQEDDIVNKDIDEGFEFEEETNQLSLSSVRRNATPQGSSKKTRTNSLQSILSHIERHRKIDMLGMQDELENKIKQQEHLQESNSNQSETQNSNQVLNEDNSSQISNLHNNEIESNSNSQLNDHFNQNNPSSLEENSHQADKSDNSTPSDSTELKQVQLEVQQLQIFQEKLPQSNLNFQNILNKNLETRVPANQSANSSLPTQESVGNMNTTNVTQNEQHSLTSTNTIISSESLQHQDHNMDFDAIGMNVKPMDFIEIKGPAHSLEMLGTDLPLPEESKQDLSEFDFQMDD